MVKTTKTLLCLVLIITGAIVASTPVFAECPEGTVPTAILGSDDMIVDGTNGERCLSGTDNGAAISHIFKTIIEIMTAGVGLLGILGIIIVGIQYLTAGGNEEQTRKAKRRMTEIVIGLVAFVSFGSILAFLIPDASTDPDTVSYQGGQTRTSSSASTINSSTPTTNSNSGSDSATNKSQAKTKSQAKKAAQIAEATKKLQNTVKANAWPKHYTDWWHQNHWKDGGTYHDISSAGGKKYGMNVYWAQYGEKDCGVFVTAMIKKSGWDTKYPTGSWSGWPSAVVRQLSYLENSDKWTEVPKSQIQKASGGGNKALKPGDIIIKVNGSSRHVMLFVGKIPGFQSQIVEASHAKFVGMSARSQHRTMRSIYNDDSSYRVFRRNW